MSASVHHMLVLAFVSHIGLFEYRQGIHVSAYAQDFLTIAHFQSAHHACFGQAHIDFVTPLAQFFRHQLAG